MVRPAVRSGVRGRVPKAPELAHWGAWQLGVDFVEQAPASQPAGGAVKSPGRLFHPGCGACVVKRLLAGKGAKRRHDHNHPAGSLRHESAAFGTKKLSIHAR
jgi:hypothetical protein